MKRIIFLDFDGVLDTTAYCERLYREGLPNRDKYGILFDPECVANLERIINATGAKVVVTSSWKNCMGFEELLAMWRDRSLPGILFDTTPVCSPHRGDEIEAWLKMFSEESQGEDYRYVILDDLDGRDFNEGQIPFLITVDGCAGLSEKDSERATAILEQI